MVNQDGSVVGNVAGFSDDSRLAHVVGQSGGAMFLVDVSKNEMLGSAQSLWYESNNCTDPAFLVPDSTSLLPLATLDDGPIPGTIKVYVPDPSATPQSINAQSMSQIGFGCSGSQSDPGPVVPAIRLMDLEKLNVPTFSIK